tara:strand:- start:430 stop:1644 length:1215 start_codon:yes stop_codon:yes gene_type:complete
LKNNNILIVVPLRGLNGATQTFTSWIKYLCRLNFNVYLAGSKGNLLDWTDAFCHKQFILPNTYLNPSFNRLKIILDIIKVNKINLVWGVGTKTSMLTGLAGLVTGTKYLNIINVSPRKSVWPFYEKWKYPNFGHNITVNNEYKNLLINDCKIPSEYCHFVPAQFDLEELVPSFPIKKSRGDLKIISLFRRFDKAKSDGVLNFIDFIIKDKKLLNNTIYQFYGGGDSENIVIEKIKKLRKNGLKFEYKGFIKDIHKAMKNSDVIVGSERVAIEGCLSGKPCLIIDDNGLVDILNQNNIHKFIFDNFTGGSFTEPEKIEDKIAVDLLSSYNDLLLYSDIKENYRILSENYSAFEGVKKLLRISEIESGNKHRLRKIYRIIKGISFMLGIQILSYIKRRLTQSKVEK